MNSIYTRITEVNIVNDEMITSLTFEISKNSGTLMEALERPRAGAAHISTVRRTGISSAGGDGARSVDGCGCGCGGRRGR